MSRVAGALLGASFFLWISGLRIISPGEIGWLMRYDWRFHFLGWHLFRSEPWHWPLGMLESYYAPLGTSIGFTDSIPLVALALKPFHAWLPPTFQYLGLWLLICFALQGVFGALLMRVWTPRASLQMVGAAMFVLMPTLLMRVGHAALCAHWLLLWALWIAARGDQRHVQPAEWGALGLVAGLIHPYLAVMVLALLAATVIGVDPRGRVGAIGALAAAVMATGAGWWASGLFGVSGPESMVAEGLGHYSMNLLAPISPTGWSTLMPEWPRATTGQDYEGFQYLGAGGLLLLGVGGVVATRDRGTLPWRLVAPLVAAALLMALYALSPRVTMGSRVLIDLIGPTTDRFAVFRATGRFFWPLAYLMLTAALALVVTRLPFRAALGILAAVAALQVVDLHGAHLARRRTARDPAFHAWAQPMASATWAVALPHYDHLVLYPPPQCANAPLPFEAAAYVAGLYGLTINAGDVGRPDVAARRAYCRDLESAMKTGTIDDRSFYILWPSEVSALRAAAVRPVVCGVVDTLAVCVTASSYERWRDAAPLN